MMKRYKRSLSISWLIMLVVVVGLSLQACVEKGAVSINCGNGGTPRSGGGDEAGCDPTNGSGHSATGFKGIGGPNPVPASPAYTCAAGSTIASNPGQSGCNTRNLSFKCTNTFTYPPSGTVGACSYGCM